MAITSRRVPALVSSTLLALGVALTVLGVVLLEARHSLLTPEGLSRRAGAALADPRVSAYVADRATDAVLTAQPDLTAFRPVVATIATATVSSHPFQRAIQVSIRSAMDAVLSGGSSKIALSIPDLGVLFRSALAQANPALAEKIPPRVRTAIGDLGDGLAPKAIVAVLRTSNRLAGLVVVLLGIGTLFVVAGFALARDRRRALLNASVHLVAAGVMLLMLRAVAGWSLQSSGADTMSREAIAGVWVAFTAGIRGWALTLAFVGLVTAASAFSVLDRISLADALARFWRVVQDPTGGVWGRLVRSALLVATGAAAVVQPREVLEWLTLTAGGALVFVGVREALALLTAQGSSTAGAPLATGMGIRRVAMVGAATALLAWGAFAMMRPAPPSQRLPPACAMARKPFATGP